MDPDFRLAEFEVNLTADEKRLAKTFRQFFRAALSVRPRPGYRYRYTRPADLTFSLQELYAIYYRQEATPVSFKTFTQHFRYFLRTVPNKRLRALFQKDWTGVWWYGARLKTAHERKREAEKRRARIEILTTFSRAYHTSPRGKARAEQFGAEGDKRIQAWFLDRLVLAKNARLSLRSLMNRCYEETGIARKFARFENRLRETIDCAEFLRENVFLLAPDLYGVAICEPNDIRPSLRTLLGESKGTPVPDDTIES